MTNPLDNLDPIKLQRLKAALTVADNTAQFFAKYEPDYDPTALPELIGEIDQRLEVAE